ncbi:unnamed protein product [Pneumocystis jirovecii]|uniref:Mitochondrial thiamine pyrophosphate carrier 1 n=1 Tax=Pneumocystis jirovecii TaxID=42068 RepID=L0PDG6_PNEJI|nr:unnamed protein product [Pneumocystis jirovecii]
MEKEESKNTSSKKKTYSDYNHAISGGISGFSARLFISPFDVVKIRLQLKTYPSSYSKELNHKILPYHGIISSVKHIIHQEGIFALWKGNCSAQILYMVYGATQFFTYAKCKSLLDNIFPEKKYNSGKSFISGAIGGALGTIASYPFDLLRTRFAAQGKSKIYLSIPQSIRSIYISEGIRGFYRGINVSLVQIMPYMGIVLGIYESSKVYIPKTGHFSYWGDAFLGIVSGTIGKTIVFPLDVIRKCLQVQGPTRTKYFYEDIPIYNRIMKTGIIIFKTEGFLGLYKGWWVSILKAAPSTAITFWTYEKSLNFINTLEQKNNKKLS